MHIDIDFLKTEQGLDDETITELFTLYVEQLTEYINEIKNTDRNDQETIRKILHSIKGTSVSVGDTILPQLCEDISTSYKTGNIGLAERGLKSLMKLLLIVKTETMMKKYNLDTNESFTLNLYEYSDWQCHMFGSNGDGISWRPLKGKEPNWFWRKMQYLCFGNKWVKDNEK